MLNEFFNRLSDGVLRRDIQQALDSSFFVNTNTSETFSGENDKFSAYIKFYKKVPGQKTLLELGHLTFHMFPNENNIPGEIGILHIQNTSNGKRPLLVTENSQTHEIALSISNNGGTGLTPIMKKCGEKAISVINRYLNPDEQSEPLSLLNHRTTISDIWNPNVDIVESAFAAQKISFSTTQRLRNRYDSHSQKKHTRSNRGRPATPSITREQHISRKN